MYQLMRIIISLGLLAFLLTRVNLPELAGVLKSINVWWFLLALLVSSLNMFLGAYRWQVLLLASRMAVPLSSLISLYFVGNFFSMFLPTVLGGDIMRTYELAKYSKRTTAAIATVVIERLIGFAALFIICLVSLPIFGSDRLYGTNILPIAVALSLVFFLLLALLYHRRLMNKILSLGRIFKRWDLESKLKRGYASLNELAVSKKGMLLAFLLSLVYQFMGIVGVFFVSKALGLDVPFSFFLVTMPIIWVIVMIPISIAGLGVRESAFVFFFTQQGVASSSALLLSLLFFSLTLATALVGGVIYGLGRYRFRPISYKERV